MIYVPIKEGHVDQVRALLNTLNLAAAPGMANADGERFPFRQFETIHFARFVVIEDRTLIDFLALKSQMADPIPSYDVALVFMGDCDGTAEETLKAIAASSGAAKLLRELFAHCKDFSEGSDLLAWMKAHEHPPAANYVNWLGRTVGQVRQEAKLSAALREHLAAFLAEDPKNVHEAETAYHRLKGVFDRSLDLQPTPPPPTPLGWLLANRMHFASVPFVLLMPWLLAFPLYLDLPASLIWLMLAGLGAAVAAFIYLWIYTNFETAVFLISVAAAAVFPAVLSLLLCSFVPLALALAALAAFLLVLRCYERNEPEIIPREPAPRLDRHVAALAEREDYDVTNQFTVVGSVKPSLFRRWLAVALLWIIDYAARHFFIRGHLGRIQTIHFARWVFINDKKRLIFFSNYDGSLEAYMDDFINKVGWGLNLAFGCGYGYPRVNWLLAGGAKEEGKFKYTLRRHQLPSDVWYKAYPGLTAYDLARNTRVHDALRKPVLNPKEIRMLMRDLS
ncbi:MAG: hypothetical protein AAGF86_08615 [Pseudomonadota bacterium]